MPNEGKSRPQTCHRFRKLSMSSVSGRSWHSFTHHPFLWKKAAFPFLMEMEYRCGRKKGNKNPGNPQNTFGAQGTRVCSVQRFPSEVRAQSGREQKTSPKLGCLGTLHEGNPCYPCARERVVDTTTALAPHSCTILGYKIHFATNRRSRLRVWMEGHVDWDGKRGSLVIASYDYRNTFSPFPPVWLYTFQFPGEKVGNVFLVAISLRTWFAQRLLTIRTWWACDSLFILVV